MIEVEIQGNRRQLSETRPDWVNREINGRRSDGKPVCLRVRIDCPQVTLNLASSDCGGGGGGRKPTQAEQEVIELWRKHRLHGSDFPGGKAVAFLKQLERRLPGC